MLSIAIKLSKIGKDNVLKFNDLVCKYFDYFVIDAERRALKDENILENLRNAIITIQSKRKNVFDLLEFYSSYDFDLCIVLGNRAYLSKEERGFRRNRILEVINKALNYRNYLWVGTEGVEDIVKETIEENNLTAYYIYGTECKINVKRAVYVPFATKINEIALKSMENYLKRRKNYKGNWQDFLLSLRDIDNFKAKDEIIVGYPIIPSEEEILNFRGVLKLLSRGRDSNPSKVDLQSTT